MTPGLKGTITNCPHTERKHFAFGMCRSCCWAAHYYGDPDYRKRHLENGRKSNLKRIEQKRAHGREYARKMREIKGDEMLARNRKWRHEHPQLMREYMLQTNYGITQLDYLRMLFDQRNSCAICHRIGLTLIVDHKKWTKKPRGLICGKCNGALGMVEKKRWYKTALTYLVSSPMDLLYPRAKELVVE